jgi:hypothetical protein
MYSTRLKDEPRKRAKLPAKPGNVLCITLTKEISLMETHTAQDCFDKSNGLNVRDLTTEYRNIL